MGDVIADLENGWSPQCLDRPAQAGEWGVLKVSAASSGRFRADQNKALPRTLSARPHLEVKAGQAIITRASGVASLVGIPAYINETPSKLMLCDKLFRVVPREEGGCDIRFLVDVLSQPLVRQQVFGEFSTESGMMKNISKPALLALTFPLPPLDVQRALVADLAAARTRAAALRAAAAAGRAEARAAFDAALWA